jgi:hypothetical protein
MARRWYQFNLKSLMAIVVVICLGLGGWHLLFTYGQYVEAEPAVVGQPIKIRGRFFHFGGEATRKYNLDVFECCSNSQNGHLVRGTAHQIGLGRYELEFEMDPVNEPTEFTLELRPKGGSPISGNFVVRGAEL